MRMADLVPRFEAELKARYGEQLLPGHFKALSAMKRCRNAGSLQMLASCPACHYHGAFPHSCGHRACPHCQHFESERWIERQGRKRLPVSYFMITFTLPAQLRRLAFRHQRIVYDLLFKISWQTLKSFGLNDPDLQGQIGATGVLHTNARNGDYHPHVHWVVPAGAVDRDKRCWRKKRGKYLFRQQNLAKVFRAKMLSALKQAALKVKQALPKHWVVHVKGVGSGEKAICYLGQYLYRGVIREKDILSVRDGEVTFRYTDNTGQVQTRCLDGADFLWMLLKHVLPRGFRRARDYGFLHANSKSLIVLVQLLFQMAIRLTEPRQRKVLVCPHCGAALKIVAWRVRLAHESTMGRQTGGQFA